MATAQQVNSANHNQPLTRRKRSQEVTALKRKALDCYELAQSDDSGFFHRQEQLEQARASVLAALNLAEADGDLFNLLARIDLDLGHGESARQAISDALNIHPRNGGYWYSAGHIHLALGELADAETAFNKAIRYLAKETRAESSLAYTYALQGRHVEAFQLYRELAKTNSHDPHIRNKLIECIAQLKADDYDSELELDLIHYFSWEDIDAQKLSSLTCTLIERKFEINAESCRGTFDDLANDPLFLIALTKTTIKSPALERLIMALRYELLLDSTRNSQIRSSYLPLASALCCYGYNSEFLLPETDTESNMMMAIRQLIESAIAVENCEPRDISGAILLLGMYEPLNKHGKISQFIKTPLKQWNAHCKSVIELYQKESEQKNIPIQQITVVRQTDTKKQYESYPYPKWRSLEYRRPTDYGHALSTELASVPSLIYKNNLSILIAGCGTGRHAIHVAKYFKNVDVTAIDFSRNSLAFAKRKAKELGVENIQFYQADLLHLNKPEWQFDIIECSGVLHHIRQPHRALTNLLKHLAPGGIIKIALYSERARKPIYTIRDFWQKQMPNLDERKIKLTRQAIMASEMDGKDRLVISDDFYSLSGCKDLLFNEYEKAYSPASIQKMCEKQSLKFLGFVRLSESVKSVFSDHFGHYPNAQTDLNLWDQFEDMYPDTFSGMYQFYCQYQPGMALLRK